LNAQRRRWTEAQAAIEAGEVVDASVFLTKTIKRTEHSAGFRTLLEGWMDASKLFFRGDNDEFDLILEETRKEEAKRLALIEKAENQILGKVLEEGERVDVWEKSKLGKKLFSRLDVLKRREEAVDPLLAGLKGEIPHFSTNRYAVPDKVFASLFVFVCVCMYVCGSGSELHAIAVQHPERARKRPVLSSTRLMLTRMEASTSLSFASHSTKGRFKYVPD
jgi:hypothetical protein